MRAVDAGGPPYLHFPFASEARRFMHMAVQRKQRLPLFNKPSYRDTADMHIDRNFLAHLAIQCCAIKRCVARRCMEQTYCPV